MSSSKDRPEQKSAVHVKGGGGSSKKPAAEKPAPAASSSRSSSPSGDGPEPFVRDVLAYEAWKETLPVLYDCFLHSNLEWPSYALAWGPVVPDAPPAAALAATAAAAAAGTPSQGAAAASTAAGSAGASAAVVPEKPHLTSSALEPQSYPTSYITQTFFFSRSTDSKLEKDKWVGSPNMLLKGEIYYPNQYRVQDISKMAGFDEDQRNPALVIRKKIVHPGEINRIKLVPQFPDLVATHTDSPLVYIWNTNTQQTRRTGVNIDPSVPDLTLQGHEESEGCATLYYALDCSKHAPLVLSGGSDQKLCLWDINDYCSTLFTTAHAAAAAANPSKPSSYPATKKHIDRLLSPRVIFTGHTAQVEEVCFHPNSPDLLCSVGDDRFLMVWDVRTGGSKPVVKIYTQHTADVNAVHWNPAEDNLLLTGSSDHTVKLIDLRRISNSDSFTNSYAASPTTIRSHTSSKHASPSVVETFIGHKENVTNVQWHPSGEYFASGSDDGDLCVWSIKGVEALQRSYPPSAKPSNGSASSMDVDAGAQASSQSAKFPSTDGLPPQPLWDTTDGQPAHLLFRHTGHRTSVVNFAWNPFIAGGWNIASLSDDSADETLVGGGRLHMWRMTDLLTNPWNRIVEEFAGANLPPPTASAAGEDRSGAVAPMEIDGVPVPSPSPVPEGEAAAYAQSPTTAAEEEKESKMELEE